MQASAPATPRGGLTTRAMSERGLVVVPEQPQYAEGADFMYFVVSPKVSSTCCLLLPNTHSKSTIHVTPTVATGHSCITVASCCLFVEL
jgi:hypothetical protein